jgi:inner membrane protein
MSPITHFIGSWLVAAAVVDSPRDRRLITIAGIIPDADGLGMVVDVINSLTSGKAVTYEYYQKYHHIWMHGWPAALAVAFGLMCFAQQRWRVALGCLITFHLHLLCDFVGSRGPSPADIWPILYSEPLFKRPIWMWEGQWRLNGWQNTVIFIGIFAAAYWVAIKQGRSFVEFFSRRADAIVVGVLRKWSTRFTFKSRSS